MEKIVYKHLFVDKHYFVICHQTNSSVVYTIYVKNEQAKVYIFVGI